MGTYDTMKKAMKATGLYRLDGTTAVDCELQAYAEALDPLCGDLKRLRNESFVPTAEDYGLSSRELALGILWPPQTTQERRKMICTLGAVGPNDCSLAALERLLSALGFTADAEEDLARRRLTIRVTKAPYGDAGDWEEMIGRYLPAQLEAVWEYGGTGEK